MPSTCLSLNYHLIFSARHRAPQIAADWHADFHAYLVACRWETEGRKRRRRTLKLAPPGREIEVKTPQPRSGALKGSHISEAHVFPANNMASLSAAQAMSAPGRKRRASALSIRADSTNGVYQGAAFSRADNDG